MDLEWTTACPDWAQKLIHGQSMLPPPLFPEVAEQALDIFKSLKIVDAPNSPTFGESCAEWVFDLVACIFGSYNPDDGRRYITEIFVMLPKKNSKSTIAAGIMNTALILNWRMSAEYTVLAPTIEVANNAYAPARDMIKYDEELDALCQVQNHVRTISHRNTNATLKVVAADANTVSGKKSVGTLIDELWLFGKMPNAEDMLREATGGMASRPEGFVIYLTTQSNEPPAGVFKQKLEYARAVRDGRVKDKNFLPLIFEHPPEMVERGDHLLLENMAMVNPNMGYSVDHAFLEREYKKAKENGEESFRGFMAKHANVEIGLRLRADRWPGADFWERQILPQRVDLETLIAECEVIDIGIDGGGLDDLLGFSAVGRNTKTRQWMAYCKAWAHESVLERRKSEISKLKDFEKSGDVRIIQHIGEDMAELASMVQAVYAADLLDKIGIDPAGVGSILDALVEIGIPEDKVVGISQGWKLGGAIKTTERKLAEGGLVHGGQALMAWCVGNARVEPRGNSILITKQASGSAKIDPLMALFNAVSLMALNPASCRKEFQIHFF